jgi:phosphoribosyl 1,2-cyclic phosphate phosphodiesterase
LTIKFLGTGTSQGIPVVGCRCETCTSTNPQNHRLRSSVYIEIDNVKILIDTGPDLRQQLLRYNITDVDAILITHEHNDHTAGLDDIRPINFIHNKSIPLYAMERVVKNIEERFAYVFDENPYPGSPKLSTHIVSAKSSFFIKNIEIYPIEFKHSSLDIFGYVIGRFAYITDASFMSDDLIEFLNKKQLKCITLNALHHKSHHSHFSLTEAVKIAQKINAEETYLIHMSHTMGNVEDWAKDLPANIKPGFDGMEIMI